MAQPRDDVEYDTKHDVGLSATISTLGLAVIHHRIVGAKPMFPTESVHPDGGGCQLQVPKQEDPCMWLSRNAFWAPWPRSQGMCRQR
jgi:hypothetical protein